MNGVLFEYGRVFISKYRGILLYVLKVVSYYSILWFFVVGYNGLVDPNGKFDLSHSLGSINLISIVCKTIEIPASWILRILNYTTFINGNIVGVIGSGGVRIELPCLGIKALISMIVLVACYSGDIKNKIVFLTFSLPVLHGLNIIRITILAVCNYTSNSNALYHYQIYDYVIYAYIAFAFYVYVAYFTNSNPVDGF